MTRGKYAQISVMMFLYYFAFGTQLPILSLYFTEYIGLTGSQSGIIMAMGVVGLLIAPLIGTFITDRLLTAERLLSVFQLCAGIFMLALFFQRSFAGILVFYMLYVMVFNQGGTLINTITFHNNPSGYFNFGNVRKWGTVGWVAGAFVFGFLFQNVLGLPINYALVVSGVTSLVLGLSAFSLNSSLKKGEKRRASFIPRSAIEVVKNPVVIMLFIVCFLNHYMDSYFYFGVAPYLKSISVKESLIMPLMTFAQLSEVITLFFLGAIIKRIGYKRTLLLGIFSQLFKFAFLVLSKVVGGSLFVSIVGFLFHGFACSFFLFTSYIYLDVFTDKESRSGAFYIMNLTTAVLSKFLGNYTAGFFMDKLVVANNNYTLFWAVAMFIAVVSITVTVFFKDDLKFDLAKS